MSFLNVQDPNIDITQYTPQRHSPIHQRIVKKFLCEEDVVGNMRDTRPVSLTWNIQTAEEDLVMKSVRLHIPMRIYCKSGVAVDGVRPNISMRMADRFPAANVALSSSPLQAFSDCQLILNDKIFSIRPNRYQSVLDMCYQGRDEMSYMSNHSLKPSALRNFKKDTENIASYPVLPLPANEDQAVPYVSIYDAYSAQSDHMFNLAETNSGFNKRSMSWQTSIQGSDTYAETDVCAYLDVGPFCNKVRQNLDQSAQYNTAIPYAKSLHLRMMFDNKSSQYDDKYNSGGTPLYPGKTFSASFLEYGTPVNLSHIGQAQLPDQNWAQEFDFNITSKPYLEIEYVQYGSALRDKYSLRYIDYIHETSDRYQFTIPTFNVGTQRLSVPSNHVIINSRLTEVPSKVYVWAELAPEYKKSFWMGGVQRCLRLKETLQLRINNRNDVLWRPTKEFLFSEFKRLTSNSWDMAT